MAKNDGIPDAIENCSYESGVAEFLGVSEGEVSTGSSWSEGVDSVSASEFQNSVEGKGDKWARNVREGLTR